MTKLELEKALERLKYLDVPINELSPKISGSFLKLIKQVEAEAARKHIKFRPSTTSVSDGDV